jgi:hypothetical protein
VREHSRKPPHVLREESHGQTVPLAFALVLVTEPLPVEPVASAAAELAAAEAPTANPFGIAAKVFAAPNRRPVPGRECFQTLP